VPEEKSRTLTEISSEFPLSRFGGDSGAPIFLLRDRRFELGGMVTFLVSQARGLGFGVKINSIMDSINKYLKEDESRP
jgi:hypothetical protein